MSQEILPNYNPPGLEDYALALKGQDLEQEEFPFLQPSSLCFSSEEESPECLSAFLQQEAVKTSAKLASE